MNRDVIIACDFSSRQETLGFLDRFTGRKPFVKIGMELFYAEGPSIVREIKARGHRIFLDLKLHDIPNTVKKAMRVLSALDVDMVNVHASGTVARYLIKLFEKKSDTPAKTLEVTALAGRIPCDSEIKAGTEYKVVTGVSVSGGTRFHNLYTTLPSVSGGESSSVSFTTSTSASVYTDSSAGQGGMFGGPGGFNGNRMALSEEFSDGNMPELPEDFKGGFRGQRPEGMPEPPEGVKGGKSGRRGGREKRNEMNLYDNL